MKPISSLVEQLQRIEEFLAARVLGQASAISDIGSLTCAWLAGVIERAPRLLLLGPTGVGKTASAEAVSEAISGKGPERFDMSEFCEPEATRWWLGDRSGDTGRLAPLLQRRSRTVVLLDEIEKAHSTVIDLLLPMLEPGHLTLAGGQRLDLREVMILCTSNVASGALVDVHAITKSAQAEHVLAQARRELRPELINRFDAAVVFHPLDVNYQENILQLHLQAYLEWLVTRGFKLRSSPSVEGLLLLRGFDRQYGARPLRRVMRRMVGDAIVEDLKQGGTGSGNLVVSKDRLVIQK
ncbi:MAG: ATP-dependent Clp protease ATP-binding subunit [Verrucomicrobiales bacterium]|nr:ATP-dependent Clp protease ATP-binding subunit [Verrucomicrobiales bacterium]